jgi:hypothetical protein
VPQPAVASSPARWPPDGAGLVEELRAEGIDVVVEEVVDEETVRVEVIASGKQLAGFRDEATFQRTQGQQRVDRTPDVATGDDVFRPYDGEDGIVALANANPDRISRQRTRGTPPGPSGRTRWPPARRPGGW